MPRRYAARAFSIIELIVVVGIIAVLVSLLIPTIGRARESSRRTTCASNLRQIGAAALAFAVDHDGLFPMTYATPVPATDRRRMPLLITRDDTITKGDGWRDFGTPWSEWNRYGATESAWHCPSSRYELKYVNGPDEPQVTPSLWGPLVWTDYAYIGGMYHVKPSTKQLSNVNGDTTLAYGKSNPYWGIAVPAVSTRQSQTSDGRLSERLLATDAAFYAGNSNWSRQVQINHPVNGKPYYVGYQNLLYADGHVASQDREAYRGLDGVERPLNQLSYSYNGKSFQRYSLWVDSKGKIGGYHFWGSAVANTPGQAIVPPPPPVPTTPAPAPTGTTPPPTTPAPTVPPPPPPPPANLPDPL